MAEELKVTGLKQWDDVQMRTDGTVREITRVRFFIGSHGPFERVFDRGVDERTVTTAIQDKQQELGRLEQL